MTAENYIKIKVQCQQKHFCNKMAAITITFKFSIAHFNAIHNTKFYRTSGKLAML